MEKQNNGIDLAVLKHLLGEHGVTIPCRKDYSVFVAEIVNALEKSALAKRDSWEIKEVTRQVDNTLTSLYVGYVQLLNGERPATTDRKRYHFEGEIEHEVLMFFLRKKEWGKKITVFSYLVNETSVIAERSGVHKDVYEEYLYSLSEELFAAWPAWCRQLIRIVSWAMSAAFEDSAAKTPEIA